MVKPKKKKQERTQIVTTIDPDLKKELFKALIDEGISFREWVERNALLCANGNHTEVRPDQVGDFVYSPVDEKV
jgi:hypothetical protein